jgi:hypothetical protein
MSIDYYMVCPKCKAHAIILRWTAGGANPPNGFKVHDFYLGHSDHEGFLPVVHEGEFDIRRDTEPEDSKWLLYYTFGEGRTAEPDQDGPG